MKKTEFKVRLKLFGIDYEVKGKVIQINGEGVYLSSLTTLPEGTQFNNGGSVDLHSLTTLPEGTQFNNGGGVYLHSLTTLPEGTQFNNGGGVYLHSLTILPEGTQFNNGGSVDLSSLTTLPEGTQFNNGDGVYLSSLTTLPEGTQFNNGGSVYLRNETKYIKKSFFTRFKIPIGESAIVFKRVSGDWETQEKTKNETLWIPGTTVTHKNWNPSKQECGDGKFHACARPGWCDVFRSGKGDRYIAIRVKVEDFYEWTESTPDYPSKIAFREGYVVGECDRNGVMANAKTE